MAVPASDERISDVERLVAVLEERITHIGDRILEKLTLWQDMDRQLYEELRKENAEIRRCHSELDARVQTVEKDIVVIKTMQNIKTAANAALTTLLTILSTVLLKLKP